MRYHQIDDDFQTKAMGFQDHGVNVFESAKDGIDVFVVRDVVAIVSHRRFEEGRYPNSVGTKLANIWQPGQNSPQITNAIAVGILKRARVDLVDDGAAPPISASSFSWHLELCREWNLFVAGDLEGVISDGEEVRGFNHRQHPAEG